MPTYRKTKRHRNCERKSVGKQDCEWLLVKLFNPERPIEWNCTVKFDFREKLVKKKSANTNFNQHFDGYLRRF